jgi:hypothetical protein
VAVTNIELRRVMVHQPHLFPWPPYVARLMLTDRFIVLDDVAYRKNYYQNRFKLIAPDSRPLWLTLPVAKGRQNIREMPIKENATFIAKKWRVTFSQLYARSVGWSSVWPSIDEYTTALQDRAYQTVGEASIASIHTLCRLVGISTVVVPSSEIRASPDRTGQATNASAILLGWGGSSETRVHDINRIRDAGLSLLRFNQEGARAIEPSLLQEGVSTLHWLFQWGPERISVALHRYKEIVESVQ